jgi:hypothetical protein
MNYTDPTGATPLQILDVNVLFSKIVGVVILFTGLVLFVMLIMGGIKFITAGGEPDKVAAARKTLTYAIGGVVLIAIAYLILVIIETLTGVPVTDFGVVNP